MAPLTEIKLEQLRQCRRINVVGTSGSGKSTFSQQLAERLDIPHYELDRLYWKANWQASSNKEIVEKVRQVSAEESWIIDGNYTMTDSVKWSRSELVIWLDMSFARTFSRVARQRVPAIILETRNLARHR